MHMSLGRKSREAFIQDLQQTMLYHFFLGKLT
jgi:hypothetical protein